jgi:polyphosphate kinase 2 (PPK2 family)
MSSRAPTTGEAVASLADVDLKEKLGSKEGALRIEAAQKRLLALRLQLGGLIGGGRLGPPLCVLFEGWDAAGKGGAIRRLVSPLDPRHVRVSQFAAPSEDERRHHFLHRFAPALPGWGGMAVLDRSWYGRVLVERVEGFATEEEWRRAYAQIVGFEHGLATEGLVLVKFWLHVSEDEQMRRFRARERDPLKRWKLTGEDWRNLSHRADYEQAVEDMLAETDHALAAWHVVAAESKPYARVRVLEIVIEAVEKALRTVGQEPVAAEAAL